MNVRKLLSEALREGANEAEVFVVGFKGYEATTTRGMVERVSAIEETKLGLRVAIGKRVGGVAISGPVGDLGEVIRRAISIARSSTEDVHWAGFAEQTRRGPEVRCYDKRVAEVGPEDLVDLHRLLVERAREEGRGLGKAEVVGALTRLGVGTVRVLNSRGVDVEVEYTVHGTWLEVGLEDSSFAASRVSARFLVDDVLEASAEAVRKASMFRKAKPVDSGVYEVVLAPEVVADFLESAFLPALSALNVLEGRSPLAGRVGQRVLSELVTVIDDPTLELESGTRPYDDEGVGTTRKEPVSRGELWGFVHSYYTAMRMGEEPTGNGFRGSPASSPMPSFTNLVVKPGSGRLEDFTRDLRRGLVVYATIGHWTSDPVSGRARATVTHGLLVSGGEVLQPVAGVNITGSVYDWFGDGLVALGSDVVTNEGASTPSAFVRGVRVGG